LPGRPVARSLLLLRLLWAKALAADGANRPQIGECAVQRLASRGSDLHAVGAGARRVDIDTIRFTWSKRNRELPWEIRVTVRIEVRVFTPQRNGKLCGRWRSAGDLCRMRVAGHLSNLHSASCTAYIQQAVPAIQAGRLHPRTSRELRGPFQFNRKSMMVGHELRSWAKNMCPPSNEAVSALGIRRAIAALFSGGATPSYSPNATNVSAMI